MPVAPWKISRDPPGYPDRRLHRNYRYFMNQIRVQATTRLLVIEPILTGVDVFAANGTSAVMLHDDGASS